MHIIGIYIYAGLMLDSSKILEETPIPLVQSQVAGAMRISISWALEVWPTWPWPYRVCLAWRVKMPMPNSFMDDLG